MSDFSNLENLAKVANAVTGDVRVEMTIASDAGPNQEEIDAVTAFMGAATPAAILALFADIDRLAEEYDKAWRHDLNDKNNVQALAAEVVRLNAELDRLRTAEGDAMTYKAGMENVAQQRDQLKAENERLERNRDMWKAQVERQAEELTAMRKEGE